MNEQSALKFPYTKRSKYPGLTAKDTLVWEQFISDNPNYYTHVQYNIRVGEGIRYIPDNLYTLQNMAKKLTQMRIDVIGYRNRQLEIIELKPICGATMIGQLIIYPILYNKTYQNHAKIITKGICFHASDDIKTVAKILNITVIEVIAPDNFYV